MIKIWKWLLSA